MRAKILFREYTWLVNTIRRAGRITLSEISRRWEDNTVLSEGRPMSRSTFIRHKEAVEEIFGISIACDESYRYYIENDDVLSGDTIQNWMLSTISVSNVLSESRSVSDRILLDPIPSDGEHLHEIIDAMKSGLRLRVTYHRYGSDHESVSVVEPYFVKLFSKRWYVIVRNPLSGHVYPLALDRIKVLEVTGEEFTMPEDFSPAEYMRDQYGVVIDEEMETTRVVIRAYGQEADYMRDLPLHGSQREIAQGEGWSDFELRIRLTYDFTTPLLARGANIQVLEPPFLADEIRLLHEEAAQVYSGEDLPGE